MNYRKNKKIIPGVIKGDKYYFIIVILCMQNFINLR